MMMAPTDKMQETSKLREIAWNDICPWLILLRTVRVAMMARVLVLGTLGLVATTVGWQLIGTFFADSDNRVLIEWNEAVDRWAWEDVGNVHKAASAKSAIQLLELATSQLVDAPIRIWCHMTRPFVGLFHADLNLTGFLCLLLCCVWELLVWGLFGGAITRIAALRLTRGEAPALLAATKHAGTKILSYSMPPLMALAGAAVFAGQLMLLGLAMRIGWVALIVGIAWPFVLLLGMLMAILLIGALIGWPLMWATVSVEGTDGFDALSRSYAYTYQRPFHLLWYVSVAALLAVVSMFVVKIFAATAIALGDWSVGWTLGEAASASGEAASAALASPPIHFWKTAVAALVAGYQAAFLWTAAVAIYLLLRRDIDHAEMDEIYLEDEEEFGIPPLEQDDSTGVPSVSPGAGERGQ